MELTYENVDKVFKQCMYTNDEIQHLEVPNTPPEDAIKIRGTMAGVAFHPKRVERAKEVVTEWLMQLHPGFLETSTEEGLSFLQGCQTQAGEQWGEHYSIDQLFNLGMAIGRVKPMFPRFMWTKLPGGMPYYFITTEEFDPTVKGEFSKHMEKYLTPAMKRAFGVKEDDPDD